jgi:acetoin utilization protein AcuB
MRSDLRVSDLMTTALVTVKASDNLVSARSEMEVGVFRHLPVVDDRNHLVGVLSDRDVIHLRGTGKHVSDVMTRDVITVKPGARASDAASIMIDNKIGSVPVVDEAGVLVGLITQTDYLEVARRSLLGLPLER